jgi:predicted amidohydrolase
MSDVTIACYQGNSVLGDVSANLARALDVIADAGERGADVVLFPETYLQGYRADELFAETAEAVPGPSTTRIAAAAREHDLYVVMGLARAEVEHPYFVYNSAALVGPEGVVGFYDKIHLGTLHPFRESMYFARGTATPVFDTRFGRVSIQICNDFWYPELSRVYTLGGATLNLVLSAGPHSFCEHWTTMLKARAMENQAVYAYTNVAGAQKDFAFFGGAQVVTPDGEVVVRGPLDEEALVVTTIDLARVERARRKWMILRDRVPELYDSLTERR